MGSRRGRRDPHPLAASGGKPTLDFLSSKTAVMTQWLCLGRTVRAKLAVSAESGMASRDMRSGSRLLSCERSRSRGAVSASRMVAFGRNSRSFRPGWKCACRLQFPRHVTLSFGQMGHCALNQGFTTHWRQSRRWLARFQPRRSHSAALPGAPVVAGNPRNVQGASESRWKPLESGRD